jgi:hypothetical protein
LAGEFIKLHRPPHASSALIVVRANAAAVKQATAELGKSTKA